MPARPPRSRAPLRRGRGDARREAARSRSPSKPARAVAAADRSATTSRRAGGRPRGSAALARPRRAPRTSPTFGLTGNNFVPRYLGGIARTSRRCPIRSASRRGRAGSAGSAAPTRRGGPQGRRGGGRKDAARSTRSSTIRRPDHARRRRGRAPEIGRWEGKGALRTLLAMSRVFCVHAELEPHRPAGGRDPAGFTADGLPRSVQLVGRRRTARTTAALARRPARGRATGWPAERPAGRLAAGSVRRVSQPGGAGLADVRAWSRTSTSTTNSAFDGGSRSRPWCAARSRIRPPSSVSHPCRRAAPGRPSAA